MSEFLKGDGSAPALWRRFSALKIQLIVAR